MDHHIKRNRVDDRVVTVGRNLRVVIDHLGGSRRGQRQEFAAGSRIRFGRHPDSEVCFDAHRDLDASSRHAELHGDGDRFVLRDTGSSNGTWADGNQVSELTIAVGTPVVVDFGDGGPRLRLFVGDDQALSELPDPELCPEPRSMGQTLWPVVIVAVVLAIGFIAWGIW